MLNDKMKAEDIVQDVFIKLFNNFSQIHNYDSILFWLYKSTKNEIFSYFRSKSIKNIFMHSIDPEEINVQSKSSVADEYEATEMNVLIHNALDNMPNEQKEVFILREYTGLSYKEIATLCAIDEELVKSRLYKTRQKLVHIISKIIK